MGNYSDYVINRFHLCWLAIQIKLTFLHQWWINSNCKYTNYLFIWWWEFFRLSMYVFLSSIFSTFHILPHHHHLLHHALCRQFTCFQIKPFMPSLDRQVLFSLGVHYYAFFLVFREKPILIIVHVFLVHWSTDDDIRVRLWTIFLIHVVWAMCSASVRHQLA